MFTYNMTVHEGTKLTTYELLYGKFARARSVDTSFEKMRKDTYDAHFRGLQYKIIKSFDQANDNHNETLSGSKTYYDRKTRRELLPGCNVYLLKDARKGKFDSEKTQIPFFAF